MNAKTSLLPLDIPTLRAAVESHRDESVDLLLKLVSFPSLVGREQPAQAFVRDTFESLGLQLDEFEVDQNTLETHPAWSPGSMDYAGRPNVVGIHRPRFGESGRSLILNGHIDVVPVGDERLWTRPPFEPYVSNGQVFGRGSADMKAGITAFIMAWKILRELGLEPAAPVYLQSVIEEECTGNGALSCLVRGYTADAAIIPEPTSLRVMDAQMGVIWLELEVSGKPAHAAFSEKGGSAISMSFDLFAALKELEGRQNAPQCRHARYADHFNPVKFNLGTIEGGEWTSSVATNCRSTIRVGTYPGTTVEQAIAAIREALDHALEHHANREIFSYTLSEVGFRAEGFALDHDIPLIAELRRCHHEVLHGEAGMMAFTGTTDAKFFNLYGETPAVCYGPGGENTHGIDESVAIDELLDSITVIAWFIVNWCKCNPIE